MKSARRRAREYALQGLYQWQLAGHTPSDIRNQLAEDPNFDKADAAYFRTVLDGTIAEAETLKSGIAPALDRKVEEIVLCHRECGGDLDLMVERLMVSRDALHRRIRELGLVS